MQLHQAPGHHRCQRSSNSQHGRTLAPAMPVAVPGHRNSHVAEARRNRGGASTLSHGTASSNGHDPAKSAKMESVELAIAKVTDKFGKGSIMRHGDKPWEGIARFPSGCLALDAALGGGYPRGRIVEIYGPESCGKTTLALHAIAEVQKSGGTAMLIDVEQALDRQHAQRLGVDMEALMWAQPTFGEEALEIVDIMASSGGVDLIVVDSVSALVPQAELAGDMTDTTVGGQARLMSKGLRKLIGTANKSNCAIMFINQLRSKVGVLYGNPETTSGGNALKYYASVRVDLRKKEAIKSGEDTVGIRVRAKVVKNKTSPPFKEASFDILFDRGIDSLGSLVDAACLLGVITKKGSWYYLRGDLRLGQGKESAVEAVRADPSLLAQVQEEVNASLSASPEALLELAEDDLIEPYDDPAVGGGAPSASPGTGATPGAADTEPDY